jgi:hypothetical protein
MFVIPRWLKFFPMSAFKSCPQASEVCHQVIQSACSSSSLVLICSEQYIPNPMLLGFITHQLCN